MDKSTHKVRREQWAAIINECLASGMPKTTWCKANGISDNQFFYWQRILRQEAYQQLESQSSSPASSALVLDDKKEQVSVETAKANGLNPFRYLEFLLTEMMEHEEDTDYGFLDDLLPWSASIPDICKIQSKKNDH